jgi:hypothetical protein
MQYFAQQIAQSTTKKHCDVFLHASTSTGHPQGSNSQWNTVLRNSVKDVHRYS